MNKTEIAAALRQEVGELEVAINKLQTRCDKLKQFVIDLEDELAGAKPPPKEGLLESNNIRKAIDAVFGEKPKRKK